MFKLDDVEAIAKEKLNNISVEEWQKVCVHVDEIVQQYIEKENILDDAIEMTFMVNTGDSSETVESVLSHESGVAPL